MTYDLITVGRVTMDLHARDIGAAFEDVSGFDAMVGGSPTNVAIAAARLGLRSVAFTGVGDDLVSSFVLRYLADAGVETRWVARKPGTRTSLAMVAVQPPDRFPLSFYRENPADIHLTSDDAADLPFDDARAVLLSGNAFSRGTCVAAARYCAERAERADLSTFLDLDLRPTEWPEPRAYGLTLRSVLPLVEVVIGTEEEFHAAVAPDPSRAMSGELLEEADRAELDERLDEMLRDGLMHTIVLKRGARGVTVATRDGRRDVPGFPVEAVNTIGAGDAFAAGFIQGRLAGWDETRSARFANACGAIQVTRHGCSSAFPTADEVRTFADEHGGL